MCAQSSKRVVQPLYTGGDASRVERVLLNVSQQNRVSIVFRLRRAGGRERIRGLHHARDDRRIIPGPGLPSILTAFSLTILYTL